MKTATSVEAVLAPVTLTTTEMPATAVMTATTGRPSLVEMAGKKDRQQ